MILHLGLLTKDLLKVCQMLDDKPEVKEKLSEIVFDVSLLPRTVEYYEQKEIELPAERLEILEWDCKNVLQWMTYLFMWNERRIL